MARKSKSRAPIPYIIVFWEGESEEQYFQFLKETFHDRANLEVHREKGLFRMAKKSFIRGIYKDVLPEVDEIWFVFDTEVELRGKWDEHWEVVKKLRKKCKNALVKLFMTKGCIEYFFMLHYEKISPLIATAQDKNDIEKMLSEEKYCPGYKKGDKTTIWKIAEHYKNGIENGEWSLKMIDDVLSGIESYDKKIKALYFTDRTFTNTHEAVQYLVNMEKFTQKI